MITFTTQRISVENQTVVQVLWNDDACTMISIHPDFAVIYHGEDAYTVKVPSTNLEASRRFWTKKITRRLEELAYPPTTRLQDRIRNWKTEWNPQAA